MHKVFRFISLIFLYLSSEYRKVILRIMYPGITIDRKTIVRRICDISCADGGVIIIKNSYIYPGAYIFADENATLILDTATVGRYTHIIAKQSIIINRGVAIAEMVVIRDQDHAINVEDKASGFSSYNIAPIIIGENTWIASKATILKGVTIGNNSIIAASAVVNKSVPSNQIWGGVPARFVKNLDF